MQKEKQEHNLKILWNGLNNEHLFYIIKEQFILNCDNCLKQIR